jgi:hypothetical protein
MMRSVPLDDGLLVQGAVYSVNDLLALELLAAGSALPCPAEAISESLGDGRCPH